MGAGPRSPWTGRSTLQTHPLRPPGHRLIDSSQRLSSLASGNSLNSLWLHLLPMKLQKLQLSCVPPPPGPSCTAGRWTTAGVGPEGSTLWGQVLAGCLRLTLGPPKVRISVSLPVKWDRAHLPAAVRKKPARGTRAHRGGLRNGYLLVLLIGDWFSVAHDIGRLKKIVTGRVFRGY